MILVGSPSCMVYECDYSSSFFFLCLFSEGFLGSCAAKGYLSMDTIFVFLYILLPCLFGSWAGNDGNASGHVA